MLYPRRLNNHDHIIITLILPWLGDQNYNQSKTRYLIYSLISLGYDPNGDYIYTKGQHYGAEEWSLVNDETDYSGRRAVVLFANYGKKYLAIRNGKFTGVATKGDDCKWYLE